MTTTTKPWPFQVGDRVRLTAALDRYPHFRAPQGATGTVTHADTDQMEVKMDDHLHGAEEWDNCIVWYAHVDDPAADLEAAGPDPKVAALLFLDEVHRADPEVLKHAMAIVADNDRDHAEADDLLDGYDVELMDVVTALVDGGDEDDARALFDAALGELTNALLEWEPPVTRLAHAFRVELRKELSEGEWQQLVLRSINEPKRGVCYSHDFCDANMVMHDAFVATFGREPAHHEDADLSLWNAAWEEASTLWGAR